jgi:hypothetical protein
MGPVINWHPLPMAMTKANANATAGFAYSFQGVTNLPWPSRPTKLWQNIANSISAQAK